MKTSFRIALTIVVLAALAVGQMHPAAARTTATAPAGKVVARVNGTALTDRDLLRQMMIDFPYARQHGGRFPAQMEKDIRRGALSTIEFEELAYQEALRRKLTVAPAKLAAGLRDFKKQFPTTSDFQNYLYAEQQGSLEILRARIRRAILIDQVLKAEVGAKARPTDAQLLAFYRKNPERFRKPESVSLQTISVLIPDKATAAQKSALRQRADGVQRQAKATKDYEGFGLLAEKNSDDDWRVMMGDHKSIHRGRMPAPVERVAFTMKPGQVSDVIETENSFCIVRVNARADAKLVPFEQVKAQLRKDLGAQRTDEFKQQLETRLRKNAKVEEF